MCPSPSFHELLPKAGQGVRDQLAARIMRGDNDGQSRGLFPGRAAEMLSEGSRKAGSQ
jgi:hypothetical protein